MSKIDVPRWLELHEQIDYRYFLLGQYAKEMRKPRSIFEEAIDITTGKNESDRADVMRIIRELKTLKEEFGRETGLEIDTSAEDDMLAGRIPQ